MTHAIIPHELCPICEVVVQTFAPGESYTLYRGVLYHPECLKGELSISRRAVDHDGLLHGLGAAEIMRELERPTEYDEPPEKCPLCTKTIWPDDPTSMVQLSSDVGEEEVHRLCGLDLRVATLEKKLSELSYRIPV